MVKFKHMLPPVVGIVTAATGPELLAALQSELATFEAANPNLCAHLTNSFLTVDGDGFKAIYSIDTSNSNASLNQIRLTESKVILVSGSTLDYALAAFDTEVNEWVTENDEQCPISSNVSTFEYNGIFWILFLGRKTK